MTYHIRIDNSVPMEMRDGTLLRGDVYRPDDSEKHPAIMVRTPYKRQLAFDMPFLSYYDAVKAGYAVVIQSQRGTYGPFG